MKTRIKLYQGAALLVSLGMLFGCASAAPASSFEPSLEATSSPAESSEEQAVVSVFAGSLVPGYSNGSSETAQFIKPYGLCPAPDGGILVVDSYANQLRTVNAGEVFTLAGNADTLDRSGYPLGGYRNGAGDEAFLKRPRFADLSSEGAVVFSDTANHRIRILIDRQVLLLAGNGEAGFLDGNYRNAQFNTPSGIAIGTNGTVYVSDTLNHCIRAISPDGVVSTVAGTPTQAGWKDGPAQEALFCEPNDIQLGPDGALYVVDKGNQRIRKIVNGEVTTVAGSGTATDSTTGYIVGGYLDGKASEAQFLYPTGLFVTEDSVIYLADTGNNCIRKVTPQGVVSTVAGTRMPGSAGELLTQARFNQPIDVYFSDDILYISDSYNHAIRAVSLHTTEKGAQRT